MSKQLEREALRHGQTCVVAATFQEARHFTFSTAQRYRVLAAYRFRLHPGRRLAA